MARVRGISPRRPDGVPRSRRMLNEWVPPAVGFGVVLLVVAWVAAQSGASLVGHSVYDSYTLQALAWRDGRLALDQDYPWLELAVYEGKYWVSFPPVPAIPMWLLSFVFGENTPSAAVCLGYLLAGLGAAYALLRRYLPAGDAATWMIFVALGGTLLSVGTAGAGAAGGVWFQAQLLAFLLTMLAFLLIDGDGKRGWIAGLVLLALAVGCRPFNVVYFPLLLGVLLGHLSYLGQARRTLVPYLVGPALVAAGLAWFNFARFGNPLEFGHTYLPELEQAGEGMFVPSRLPENVGNVLRAPSIADGMLTFPRFSGFAVYLTNPMLLIGLGALLARAVRRRADLVDLILFGTILVHALLLLTHRTNGGFQYGTRYLVDLLPALIFVVARSGGRLRVSAALMMGGLVAFNVIATVVFQTSP
ncbi:MAG: hypothetical protein WB471_08880 [Nocardioides sp.]